MWIHLVVLTWGSRLCDVRAVRYIRNGIEAKRRTPLLNGALFALGSSLLRFICALVEYVFPCAVLYSGAIGVLVMPSSAKQKYVFFFARCIHLLFGVGRVAASFTVSENDFCVLL